MARRICQEVGPSSSGILSGLSERGKVKKGKRDKWGPPFVRLERRLILKDENWRQLSPGAKMLYLFLKAKYNGSNNGQIKLHYSELKDCAGFKNPRSISAAFQELEKKDWIKRSKIGGLHRFTNEYTLTGRYDALL